MIEEHFGGPTVAAVSQRGGFSADLACRVLFANGVRVFVKGGGPATGEDNLELLRAEAHIAAALPPDVPAPRLLGEFEADGWLVVVFEDIDGRPPVQPWRSEELEQVLSTITLLATKLNPSPVTAPAVAERIGGAFQGWRRLVAARDSNADLDWLDAWALRHLDALAALEDRWGEAASGRGLAHADLRADNLLFSRGRVVVVDWPWACTAVAWFDLLGMLPSIELAGGPEAEAIWARHPLAHGAEPAAVTAVLAAKTGFLLRQSQQPAPAGTSALRPFQRAQGDLALRWLRARTGWS